MSGALIRNPRFWLVWETADLIAMLAHQLVAFDQPCNIADATDQQALYKHTREYPPAGPSLEGVALPQVSNVNVLFQLAGVCIKRGRVEFF